jgi:cell division GTPase FtsZ
MIFATSPLRKDLSALMMSRVSVVMRLMKASGASSAAKAGPTLDKKAAAEAIASRWRRVTGMEIVFFIAALYG